MTKNEQYLLLAAGAAGLYFVSKKARAQTTTQRANASKYLPGSQTGSQTGTAAQITQTVAALNAAGGLVSQISSWFTKGSGGAAIPLSSGQYWAGDEPVYGFDQLDYSVDSAAAWAASDAAIDVDVLEATSAADVADIGSDLTMSETMTF